MKSLLLVLFLSFKIFATPQIPDVLIYQGKKYDWNGYSPAFRYLDDKKIKLPSEAIESTANTDYYSMTYSVENDSLYLIDIEIVIRNNSELQTKSVFKDFFPNSAKILMDYSNIQTFPYGKEISVTKNNWTDVHYKKYLVFEITNGYVKRKFDLSYNELNNFKHKLFLKFKTTEEYQKAKITQAENLEAFNDFRPTKFSMDKYLELVIIRLVKTLEL